MPRVARIELLVFFATFFAFAYFNQGGGWNQNSRFAEVRAMAEQGRFAIDDFLIYKLDPAHPDGDEFVRLPLDHAEYQFEGRRFRLSWVDMEWNLFPVNEQPAAPGVTNAAMIEQCSSGDIGYVPWTGEFHPNKPPGTSFLALPGYWVIWKIERACGLNADSWWLLTLNSWLTSVCCVALFSALGCVLFFRLAREFAGEVVPAILATFAFAFGTTFFPFSTLLFDHNLTATFLLAAFYFIRRGLRAQAAKTFNSQTAKAAAPSSFDVRCSMFDVRCFPFLLAGLCAGIAAITNYVAAVAGFFLAIYALLGSGRVEAQRSTVEGEESAALEDSDSPAFDLRPSTSGRRPRPDWRAVILFTLGVLPPFLLICWYGWICFGSPFKLSTDFQNPLFKNPGGIFGMFTLPSGYNVSILSVSPFRGIFFLAPVTIMGVYGLLVWLREKTYAAEARLCLAIFAFFFLVNASFNGYHGGFSAGPRYLVPGLPFLALPLVVAFARFRIFTCALALVSVVMQVLLTATDAQNPLAVGGHARNDQRPDFWNNLVADYAWPLFADGRAWPMLDQLLEVHLEKEARKLDNAELEPAERTRRLAELRRDLRESILRGDPSPFLLGAVEGPVSVNPIGIYEGLFTFSFFPPHTRECDWNSFNAGEFLFPKNRWSLLPLLLVTGGLGALALAAARREDEQAGTALMLSEMS